MNRPWSDKGSSSVSKSSESAEIERSESRVCVGVHFLLVPLRTAMHVITNRGDQCMKRDFKQTDWSAEIYGC